MRVLPIPCLRDNYAYLLCDDRERVCAVIDASDAAPVVAALSASELSAIAILSTHHHFDHVGGNDGVRAAFTGVEVYAGAIDATKIAHVDVRLEDGQEFSVGSLRVKALHVPGHTAGAIAYVVEDTRDDEPPWVFTGDVLFLGGCGRLFEGTPADMHHSLNEVLAKLDPRTRVACGHEYTASNLRFAAHVEPDNPDVAERAKRVAEMRERGAPTVPGTIADELLTNPFMRVQQPSVIAHAGLTSGASPADVLGKIRREKDGFQ